ncbi:unnamed protein product, partial [Mesorhabditis spiculigera]
MGLPTWLWKPKTHHPLAPVESRNYRCCCSCCTAKCGFTTVLIFWAIGALLTLGFLMIFMLAPAVYLKLLKMPEFYTVVFSLLCAFTGVRSIQTLKPCWMQLFLIFWFVGSALSWTLWIIYWVMLTEGFEQMSAKDKMEEGKKHVDTRPFTWTLLAPLIVTLLICQTFFTCLFLSYYRYVRDRQLEIDQQRGQMTAITTHNI